MYRALSTLLFAGSLGWLGYLFHRKALALTNGDMLALLGWAWGNHPDGQLLVGVFALLWLCAFTLLVTVPLKALALFLGQPRNYVFVGDELLNRCQRFYREGDPLRGVLRLPGSGGARLKFSWPTRVDGFFHREMFVVNGDNPDAFIRAGDYGLLPAIALSAFFYCSLGMCIATLHALARDFMAGEDRVVTPFDTFGEFIVVIPVLLALNGALLVAEYVACRQKLRRRDDTQPDTAPLPLAAGDRVGSPVL